MPVSPYVAELRSVLGTRLLLLPAATALVRDGADRLLLVRHSYTGVWGLVGGTIEPDERPADAAARETLEETGLAVTIGDVIAVLGGPEYRVTYPNGDEAAVVQIVYGATPVPGAETGEGDDEVTEVGWFTRDELRAADMNDFARATLRALDLL